MHRRILVFLLLLFGSTSATHSAQSQDTTDTSREVTITADSFSGRVVNGESIRRLVGNVYLEEEKTRLWSDAATQWITTDRIEFRGNVRLIHDGDTIDAQTILYDSNTKIGEAKGDVVLSDGEVVVKSPNATYHTKTKHALFDDGVTLRDSVSTLFSRNGQYWSELKRALFVGGVLLDQEGSQVRADTVDYDRNDESAEATGNVVMLEYGDGDRADVVTTLICADKSARTPDDSLTTIAGNVLLLRFEQDSVGVSIDTFAVRSDALVIHQQEEEDHLSASGNVAFWSPDFKSLSGRADYIESKVNDLTTISLSDAPIGWYNRAQVIGDTMTVYQMGDWDSLSVKGGAFLAQEDSASGRIQQVRGETITGIGRQSSDMIIVYPNAESIYFLSGEEVGGVRVSADRIVFHVADGDLDKVDALGGIEGTYYPEDAIPARFELDGYSWRPEDEPSREIFFGDQRYREVSATLGSIRKQPE